MIVTTTADEKIRSARSHLSSAYQDILDAINPQIWGSEEYCLEYKKTLHETLSKILTLVEEF